MTFNASYKKYTLQFINPARTSRGVYHTKDSWFISLTQYGITGVGECSLLKDLSIDDRPNFEEKLKEIIQQINNGTFNFDDPLYDFPAIKFGLETALLDLKNGGRALVFPSSFTRGENSIITNGLIWMGKPDFMRKQIADKLEKGFSCIKLKIGSMDWETEKSLIEIMRQQFSAAELTIRVDANGAYNPVEAEKILDELALLEVHSIEQPIKAGQWEQMARLCEITPLPIALDEELIGIYPFERKQQLLQCIKPQYIIIKPGLLGGFAASDEWITLAESMDIGWWATSALESNIGLNAIVQWTATKNNPLPQGLGTGMLFKNNVGSSLKLEGEKLIYTPQPPKEGVNYPPLGERSSALVTSVVKNNNNALPQYPPFRGLGGDFFDQKTSGSTGAPKLIKLRKEAMVASARKTLTYFKLQEGDTALLCLPIDYIAGKMMVVRAMVGGLNLIEIEPKGTPEIPDQAIHFTAMVPMQVQNLIVSGYDFSNIKTLIIGGAFVGYNLLKAIQEIPTAVYATYGMTETYSHIAVQRLNGPNPDDCFQLLDGFSISQNENGCLVIDAPEFSDEPIVTTDLVEVVSPKEFRWLGRADNVINSGGLKILPEEIEDRIQSIIGMECVISSIEDSLLGEKMVLVLEETDNCKKGVDIMNNLKLFLEKKHMPWKIYFFEKIPRLENMKTDREELKKILRHK
jgi:o-succinylbenzoate synthase